ncbi:MAG: hypothetical protein AMXMBFR58_16620 [Phycisphaerae bacterium]
MPPAAPITAPALPRSGVRAFTLVELIVVLVILAIMAGVIAPRLASGASRAAESEVHKAAELISAAGRRDTLTSQQLAIDHDGQSLRLMKLQMPSAADAARGVPPEWVVDPLALPVEFENARIVSASADGAELNPERFHIEFRQAGQRPSVVIVLAQATGTSSWTVSLTPGAFRARITSGEDRFADMDITSVDLDLAGKAEEPW